MTHKTLLSIVRGLKQTRDLHFKKILVIKTFIIDESKMSFLFSFLVLTFREKNNAVIDRVALLNYKRWT